MTCNDVFTLNRKLDKMSDKISIDALYEKKKKQDMAILKTYQKMLNRVHIQIKRSAAIDPDAKCCFFKVPEFIMGELHYEQTNCIAYLIDQLQQNGFAVQYYEPSTLFIVWEHFVPSYVREELKRKTGVQIDEFGRILSSTNDNDDPMATTATSPPATASSAAASAAAISKEKRKQAESAFKPTGVYSTTLIQQAKQRLFPR